MKAILRTFERLPLDFLFLRKSTCSESVFTVSQPAGNGWIPLTVADAGEIGTLDDRGMELTDHGLFIPSSTLLELSSLKVLRVYQPLGSSWRLTLEQHDWTYWIQLHGMPSDVNNDTAEVLILLNTAHGSHIASPRRKGNGACLLPKKTVDGVLYTSYVCSLTWEFDALYGQLKPRHATDCTAAFIFARDLDIFANYDILVSCSKYFDIVFKSIDHLTVPQRHQRLA